MWDILLLDVCLVCRIVEYDSVVLYRVVYPTLQLLACQHCACRIVGVAEVYHVDTVVRDGRTEIILLCGWHVAYIAPFTVSICAGTPYHGVRVDVYRVYRVCYTDGVIPAYYVAYVSCVALRAVVDKYL